MENNAIFGDLDAIFNPTIESQESPKESVYYAPKAENGRGGVYTSVIRFVPFWKEPAKSLKKKVVTYLTSPLTNEKRAVDDPTSVGQKSIIVDTFFKLKNSENVLEQENANAFKPQTKYSTLVQIIKDENRPELEGKILIWKFGKKLYEKIDAVLNPSFGEPARPWDIINGKAFAIKIRKDGKWPSYDQCMFTDTSVALMMPNEDGKYTQITANTDKQKVYEFLKTNSPDLSVEDYKPWDEATYKYVNECVSAALGGVSLNQTGQNYTQQQTPAQPTAPLSPEPVNLSNNNDDISVDEVFGLDGENDIPSSSSSDVISEDELQDLLEGI